MADLAYSTARMTYGNRLGRQEQKVAVEAFVPAHVSFDKKVLLFTAYMKSTVHESAQENFRVRYLKIYYYLEDDTIAIVEPEVMNSGIQQGVFLKRQRIPRDASGITYHWKELNIGCNMSVYGKIIRITDCNEWTRVRSTSLALSLPPSLVLLRSFCLRTCVGGQTPLVCWATQPQPTPGWGWGWGVGGGRRPRCAHLRVC